MYLYKVHLKGMLDGLETSYVVAESTDEAYQKVRTYLNEHNIGLSSERELKAIELVASDYMYNGVPLFV